MAKKKTTRARITDAQKGKARQMLLDKETIDAIAEKVNISTASVSKIKSEMGLTTPRGGKKATTSKPSDNGSLSVAMFALKVGGIGKAIKEVESIKDNPALDFVSSVGGVENALERLKGLEAELS